MNKKQSNQKNSGGMGRVSVVTGAAGDLGSAVSRALATQGDRVVLVDPNETKLRAVVESLEGDGHQAMTVDVSDETAVKKMSQEVWSKYKRIDALFSNAGINGGTFPIAEHPLDDFRRTLDVNITGSFLMMKHFLPLIAQAKDGWVLNTASEAGLKANERRGLYSATKAAVIQLTRAAALEYGRQGVRVNSLCPGPIEGDFMQRSVNSNVLVTDPEATHKAIADACSLGRYAETDEIAIHVRYLLTDAPPYVNGAFHLADGCRK